MTKVVNVRDLSDNDIVIALMGPTGAGKSTFINYATKQDGRTIGHALKSYTTEVRAVRSIWRGQPVVLVDTPGFDDTNKSDTEILKLIADWLEKTYKSNIKLAGVIYLHRISDNRMAGTPLKNLHMFAHLCGDEATKSVILATTMWSRVARDVGQKREKELCNRYWKGMIDNGSTVKRFEDSYDSAWDVLGDIVKRAEKDSLLLQEELVDLHKRLSETQAGITLYDSLQKALAEQKEVLQQLRAQAETQNNPALVAELNVQYDRVQEALNRTFDQIQKMKIPLGRRIILFFSFKRSRANPVKIFGK